MGKIGNYQLVMLFLGVVSIIAISGSIFLSSTNHPIPEEIKFIGGAAIAALAGILVRPPIGNEGNDGNEQ